MKTLFSTKTLMILSILSFMVGCSSGPKVKTQEYAKLKAERVFEYEFPDVWKAIESTFRKHKIVSRDPNEVDALEMKKISKRECETDWVISQSRDKYIEYKINDSPRKKLLQTRLKYRVIAEKVMGGVKVSVDQKEEIETLKSDGTPSGWADAEKLDTSRSNEILDKINQALLSAPKI